MGRRRQLCVWYVLSMGLWCMAIWAVPFASAQQTTTFSKQIAVKVDP